MANVGNVRYYLYISDAKVEMLLPQVPNAERKKVAAKFGFDVKILKGSISTERQSLDSLVSRLHTVEDYILATEHVGNVTQTASWFKGKLNMKAADIGENAVLFISQLPDSMIALGGSAHHLIGSVSRDKVKISLSFGPHLANELRNMVETQARQIIWSPESELRDSVSVGISQGFFAWSSLIGQAWRKTKGPFLSVEFLARRLASETYEHGNVTLGTPLYIAMAD
jgi:hypothetical protein